METLFDFIQTPLIGATTGVVLYFQLRRQNVARPILWSVVGGAVATVAYGAFKYFF